MRLDYSLAALLLVACLSGCGDGADDNGNIVDMASVERRDIVVAAEATGVVEPIQIVEIKSRASGEVIRMAVETGQVVKEGDLLVQVDTRDLKNALEQAQADLEVAKSSLTVAEAQKERSDRLLSQGMISDQEHEDAALAYATANAQLVKAKTSLNLAQERLDDATVRAPSAGTILEKNVEEGNIISSATSQVTGGTVLLKMADLSAVQVRTLVDETDIGRIEAGLSASITVEAYRDHEFTGTVLKVEPLAVVEQNVTMFPVLIQIPNDEGLLKPGMNADVEIHIDQRDDVLAVPVEAVRSVQEMAILAPLVGLSAEDVTSAMEGMSGRAGPGPRQGGPPQGMAGGGSGGMTRGGSRGGSGHGAMARKDVSGGAIERKGSAGAAMSGGHGAQGQGGPGGGASAGQGMGRGGPSGVQGGHGGLGSQSPGSRRISMGIAFVRVDGAFEPRIVRTGASDWDHIEVIEGVEEGERIALLPSAQLYMENEKMMERFRSRSSVLGSSKSK